tara:strand:+ start:1102 stop:1725 length:624 start_codon:yes stop_codon:yes gene_type:complete
MLQNKYKFNQSSSELVITGLPDYSKSDNPKNISIISNWQLNIIDLPTIEGGIDHLKSVLRAFYKYSSLILLEDDEKVESKLIDIFPDQDGLHKVVLKSTKEGIKPLTLRIGNAELSDIINCFDQLNQSENVKLDFNELLPEFNKRKLKFIKKTYILNIILPPIFAFLSITFVSFFLLIFYESSTKQNENISFLINKDRNFRTHMIKI